MDRDKCNAAMLAFKQRNPLRPFMVVTVAGDRHEVDFPDALAVRDWVAVFVAPGPFRCSKTTKY